MFLFFLQCAGLSILSESFIGQDVPGNGIF